MKPKSDPAATAKRQTTFDTGLPILKDFIDLKHPLLVLADHLDWEMFENYWVQQFSAAGGPKAHSARMVAGLLMLKHMEGLSDEKLL